MATINDDIKQEIIAKAREIMDTDFMQYPDFDPDIPTYLCDALTIIMAEHLPDRPTNEIYDFFNLILKIK